MNAKSDIFPFEVSAHKKNRLLSFAGIRRLQAVLVKVALILGVEVHIGTSFGGLDAPGGPEGAWRARTEPSLPAVESLALDFLIGAEGKHVTVPGNDHFLPWNDEMRRNNSAQTFSVGKFTFHS